MFDASSVLYILTGLDCSMTTCDSCHDTTARPRCTWCYEGLTCQLDTAACTTKLTDTSTCPVITFLSEDQDAVQGGTIIDVHHDYSLAIFGSIQVRRRVEVRSFTYHVMTSVISME